MTSIPILSHLKPFKQPFVWHWRSLSVNRVETPAFQAGRFQHHNGISVDESCRCSTIAV
jgi:hypothetical protein